MPRKRRGGIVPPTAKDPAVLLLSPTPVASRQSGTVDLLPSIDLVRNGWDIVAIWVPYCCSPPGGRPSYHTADVGEHGPSERAQAACVHLAPPTSEGENYMAYFEWFTGRGFESQLLCAECDANRTASLDVELTSITDANREVLEEHIDAPAGRRCAPETRERPAEIDTRVVDTPLPVELGQILGLMLTPIDGQPSCWAFARRDGTICRFDVDTGRVDELCSVELPPSDPAYERSQEGKWHGPRLHVSDNGTFGAVVHDYGNHADVYDLRTGAHTIKLRDTGHHAWTVPFPLAFLERDGRTLVVHRTHWNRLDVSDAQTGELLSAQPQQSDYTHGRLAISPSGDLLLDDGWVWHPNGWPTIWSLGAWLGSQASGSEGQAARLELACRAYYWDVGMCWLGDERVAVGGIGDDDDNMVDGVRIFSSDSRFASSDRFGRKWAHELDAFAGPSGSFFGDGAHLFSAGAAGLEIWDVDSGARTATVENFRPVRQHRGARELAEITAKALRRWRY